MNLDQLALCPFCSGKASLRNGGPGCSFVQCDACNATSDDRSEGSAIAAWNRRSSLSSTPAGVTEALRCLEELANMPLGISLEDWSRLSSPILAALSSTAGPGEAPRVTGAMVNAAWNKGKDLRMTGLPSDFRQVIEAVLSSRVEAQAGPLAWRYRLPNAGVWAMCEDQDEIDQLRQEFPLIEIVPLYAHPAPADAVEPSRADDGLAKAIAFVRKRLDDYVAEHGMYDPSTGMTEFPGNGDETVFEWEEIIEGLEALREAKS